MDLVKRLRTRDRANITLEKESKNKGQERKESLKYRCFFKTQQLGAGCMRSLGVRNWSHLKTKEEGKKYIWSSRELATHSFLSPHTSQEKSLGEADCEGKNGNVPTDPLGHVWGFGYGFLLPSRMLCYYSLAPNLALVRSTWKWISTRDVKKCVGRQE